MMTIKDVIHDREPYSIPTTKTVLEAAEFMAERIIGGVCVLDEEGRLAGILTERDLLNRIVLPRRDPAGIQISEVMSEVLAVIETTDTPHEALERMERIG